MNLKKQNKELLKRIEELEEQMKEVLDSCSCVKLNLPSEKRERSSFRPNLEEMIAEGYNHKVDCYNYTSDYYDEDK